MEHSEPRTDDAGRRRPVTILAIADEERDALTIPGAVDFGPGNRPDLLLSAGDLNYKYVTAVADAFNVPCVMVPGNHDPSLEGFTLTAAGWLRAGRHDTWPGPEGAWNADRDVVEVAGIRIAGLGGCGKYSSGPNQWSDGEAMRRAKRTLRRARKGHDGERGERLADVLLTHAPGTVGAGTDNAHRALPAVDLLVERLCPALHLHGHVHLHGAERPVTEIPAGGECRDGTNGDVANGAGTNGAGVNGVGANGDGANGAGTSRDVTNRAANPMGENENPRTLVVNTVGWTLTRVHPASAGAARAELLLKGR